MSNDQPAELASREAARGFSDLVSRAAYGHERIVLTRHGRPVAAVVSLEDLARLKQTPSNPESQ